MSQIELLKKIIVTAHIYADDRQRESAKRNLIIKMIRRDRKISKKTQLTLNFGFEYPEWYND